MTEQRKRQEAKAELIELIPDVDALGKFANQFDSFTNYLDARGTRADGSPFNPLTESPCPVRPIAYIQAEISSLEQDLRLEAPIEKKDETNAKAHSERKDTQCVDCAEPLFPGKDSMGKYNMGRCSHCFIRFVEKQGCMSAARTSHLEAMSAPMASNLEAKLAAPESKFEAKISAFVQSRLIIPASATTTAASPATDDHITVPLSRGKT